MEPIPLGIHHDEAFIFKLPHQKRRILESESMFLKSERYSTKKIHNLLNTERISFGNEKITQ